MGLFTPGGLLIGAAVLLLVTGHGAFVAPFVIGAVVASRAARKKL